MRGLLKAAPVIAICLIVIAYFGMRLASGTPVTASIDTPEGLQQRAAATQKVIRYDGLIGDRAQKRTVVLKALAWPIAPNETETAGAAEFVNLVLDSQQHAKGCEKALNYSSPSDEQISMAGRVADYIQKPDVQWDNPPSKTILAALEQTEGC